MTHKCLALINIPPHVKGFLKRNGLHRDSKGFIIGPDSRPIPTPYHNVRIPEIDNWFEMYSMYVMRGDDPFVVTESWWYIIDRLTAVSIFDIDGSVHPINAELYDTMRRLHLKAGPEQFYETARNVALRRGCVALIYAELCEQILDQKGNNGTDQSQLRR